jgi:hypothetical protein
MKKEERDIITNELGVYPVRFRAEIVRLFFLKF